jgi:16S rRNA (adenine1518-N6/adenine1519-N6)-dimethyltransferase
VVAFDRRPAPPVEVPSYENLITLARAGDGHRRKLLRQALRPVLGPEAEDVLRSAGIDPRARAETLGLDEWAELARRVEGARR